MALDEANRSLQTLNVSLELDVSEQRHRLRAIAMLGNELARIQDIDILMERVLTEARRVLGVDAGAVFVVKGDALRMTHAQNDSIAGSAMDRHLQQVSNLGGGISIVAWVASTAEIANIRDVYDLPIEKPYRFDTDFDEGHGYHTRSMLAAPLMGGAGQVIGVLQLINPLRADGTPRPEFDTDDENAVRLARDEHGYLVFPTDRIRQGKSGEEIPLFARIVAIADVVDALGSARSYKEAWPEKRILAFVRKKAGTHLDPELVDIFIDRIGAIRAIQRKWDAVAAS